MWFLGVSDTLTSLYQFEFYLVFYSLLTNLFYWSTSYHQLISEERWGTEWETQGYNSSAPVISKLTPKNNAHQRKRTTWKVYGMKCRWVTKPFDRRSLKELIITYSDTLVFHSHYMLSITALLWPPKALLAKNVINLNFIEFSWPIHLTTRNNKFV